CLFVHDFLPVRGLAVLLMLVAKLLVDTARWVDTEWRLVITTLAYVWVVAGMWFTISPWRLRDLLLWGTANETRVRFGSMIRLGLALLLVVLGLTAIRKAEQRPVAQVNHPVVVRSELDLRPTTECMAWLELHRRWQPGAQLWNNSL